MQFKKHLVTDNPKGCTMGMLNNIYANGVRVIIRFTEDGRKDVDLCDYIAEKCKCNYSAETIMEIGCIDCQMCPYGTMYNACIQAAELRERLKQYEEKDEETTADVQELARCQEYLTMEECNTCQLKDHCALLKKHMNDSEHCTPCEDGLDSSRFGKSEKRGQLHFRNCEY